MTEQRSKAVKRRREIWEALHPVKRAPVCDENNSGHSSPTIPERSAGRPKEFAAETAAVTGEAKRTINQHLARAEALGDDLDKVTGTSLDKGVELDALKAMPPEQRAPLIERAQAGEKVSARTPATKPASNLHHAAKHQQLDAPKLPEVAGRFPRCAGPHHLKHMADVTKAAQDVTNTLPDRWSGFHGQAAPARTKTQQQPASGECVTPPQIEGVSFQQICPLKDQITP